MRGVFAKATLKHSLSPETLMAMRKSMFGELANVNMIRETLDEGRLPFMTAWDLKARKMYFYVTEKSMQLDGDSVMAFKKKYEDLTNKDDIWDHTAAITNRTIDLNKDYFYVRNNIIIDDDTGMMSDKTKLPPGAIFVPYELIMNFLGEKVKENASKPLDMSRGAESGRKKGVFRAVKDTFKGLFNRIRGGPRQ